MGLTTEPVPAELERALALVAEVPDYPVPGVLFRDLNPLLADAAAFATVVDALAERVPAGTTALAALEARGFLIGAALGRACGIGVVPVRKPGKLPRVAHRVEYTLEYGSAGLELPADAVDGSSSVYVVDDVLATGGTMAAACELVEAAGGQVTGAGVVLEIAGLRGRDALAAHELTALTSVG
jgi:adenine phosphoribosyltransferase